MNTPEPIAVMEQWLLDAQGGFSLPLTVQLGLQAMNDAEAVFAIIEWMHRSRDSFALRAAEISLRAFIDYECALGTSESHQAMIDDQLLGAVDAAIVPPASRAAINKSIGARPYQRQRAVEAAEMWLRVRPTDQSIYDWQLRRFDEYVQSLSQPPPA